MLKKNRDSLLFRKPDPLHRPSPCRGRILKLSVEEILSSRSRPFNSWGVVILAKCHNIAERINRTAVKCYAVPGES